MMQIKCAIYARYSSDNQREASIDDQIRKCRELARSKGWVVLSAHIYYDKAESAKSMTPREGVTTLLEVALGKNPPFQYILVDDTSRLTRDTADALRTYGALKANNVDVYYVSQGIDTQTETAPEMITLHGMVDALYLRELSKKTHRGIEGRVLAGYSGGGRHYGYRSRPVYGDKADRYGNKEAIGYLLEIDPEEAETVRRICTYFGVKGWSAKRIASLLNKEINETGGPKPPTDRGKYWRASTISGSKKTFGGILNSELFIGKYAWNKRTVKYDPDGGRRFVINDPKDWSVMEKPELRIISDELWEAVKKRQKEIKGKGHRIVFSKNLLTKIAKCGTCGGTLCIVSGGKWGKYGCSNNWNKGSHVCPNNMKIKKELLEETVVATLCRELSKKDPLALITSEIRASLKNIMAEAAKGRTKEIVEESLKEARQEIENIKHYIRKGTASSIPDSMLVDAENMEKDLKNELLMFGIENFEDIRLTEALTQKDLETYFSKIIEGLINPETTGQTLCAIVEKVVVQCDQEMNIDIKIHENIKQTMAYVMDLIGKRDTRMRLNTRTDIFSYTSRIFRCQIGLPLGKKAEDAENLVLV